MNVLNVPKCHTGCWNNFMKKKTKENNQNQKNWNSCIKWKPVLPKSHLQITLPEWSDYLRKFWLKLMKRHNGFQKCTKMHRKSGKKLETSITWLNWESSSLKINKFKYEIKLNLWLIHTIVFQILHIILIHKLKLFQRMNKIQIQIQIYFVEKLKEIIIFDFYYYFYQFMGKNYRNCN